MKTCAVIILLSLTALNGWAQVHWSLRPVVRPQVPQVRESATVVRNPIDAFVLRRLEERKLQPSPEANRRTLFAACILICLACRPSQRR